MHNQERISNSQMQLSSKLGHFINPQHFLQVFSKSLVWSYRHFCFQKQLQSKLSLRKLNSKSERKVFGQESIIEISDDEEIEELEVSTDKKVNQGKYSSTSQPEFEKSDEEFNSTKTESLKTCETQKSAQESIIHSITIVISFENSIKSMLEPEIKFEYAKLESECPQMVIRNQQISLKKRNLLSRRVYDWDQMQRKNKKQKRELRMLNR